MARAYGLDEDEQAFLLRLAEVHDAAQAMLADVINGAIARDENGLDAALFARETPLIIDALREELSDHAFDLTMLVRTNVAEAFGTLALGGDDAGVLGLQFVVQALGSLAPHQARVVIEWLDGRAADRAGHALSAEAAYERALGLNPSWAPALESLAALANDRGDADRALSLLDRAGVDPQDGLYQMLVEFRSDNVISLGRQDPCWCGSGRKLKQCHRRGAPLPLSRRATWLYHKASAFLQDGPWRQDVLDLAMERNRYGAPGDLLQAISDPLVMSSLLFEGGVLENFADIRGPLLPEDEYDLVLDWINVDRGLYQVKEVKPGNGLLVRNVLDGEQTFVREVLGTQQARVGMLFVSLVLPVDEENFGFFGGIEPIGLHQRDEVIALLVDQPDPFELVSLMTDRFAPPVLRTTDGDDLEPRITVIKIKGRKVIDRAFDGQFTRSTPTSWIAGVDGGRVDDGESIGGTLDVDGREVTVNAMSRRRMDLLLDVIEGMGLGFEVISEQVFNVAEGLAKHPGPHSSPAPEAEDPRLAAFMAERIRQYEVEWLDLSIPALRGMTPRQAAADPVARLDLITLLESMPTGVPGGMDAKRIRADLGL